MSRLFSKNTEKLFATCNPDGSVQKDLKASISLKTRIRKGMTKQECRKTKERRSSNAKAGSFEIRYFSH